MMDKEYLQDYIEEHIPIVKEMDFSIVEINGNEVMVEGPYEKHINHRNSIFGGSISSLLILAGWTKMKLMMEKIDNNTSIVIQESNVKYLRPVLGDFVAITKISEEVDMLKTEKIYKKFGKVRVNIEVFLKEKGKEEILAEFVGSFVALKNE